MFEVGVEESNCVYRLVENRLVPDEQVWASAPSTGLLQPTEASRALCRQASIGISIGRRFLF